MTTPNYPYVWYWIVQDTNPTTQVWESSSGAMVANNSANYLSWVVNGGRSFQFTPQHQVSGAANNGAGLIRLAIDNTLEFTTGDAWVVQSISGTTEANGTWLVTVIDSTHIDLQGSAFVNAYTSGGVVDRGSIQPTAAAMNKAIDDWNYDLTPPGYLPVSSGVNYQMSNTPPLLFDFTPTAGSLTVTLSQMNLFGSLAKGRLLLIHNAGSFSFTLNKFGGSLVDTVQAGGFLEIYLTDNSTQAGTLTPVRLLRTNRQTNGNSDATFSATGFAPIQVLVTTAALTAPRTWTLPAANSLFGGNLALVADEIGGVSATNTLSVARAGADTINGGAASVVLNRARDFVLLETDGSSNWTIIGGKSALAFSDITGTADLTSQVTGTLPIANGGTAQTTGSYAGNQSWTPSDQSGAGLTFTAVNVNYERAGNIVFVKGRFTFPVTASGAAVSIGGLPVTVPNRLSEQNGFLVQTNAGFAFSTQVVPIANTTTFQLFNNESLAAITNAQMSGFVMSFTLQYAAT